MDATIDQLIVLMEELDKKLETMNMEYSDIQKVTKENKKDIVALKNQIKEVSENLRVSEDKFECKHRCDTVNSDTLKIISEMREKIVKLERKHMEMSSAMNIYVKKQSENVEVSVKKNRKMCCVQ